MPDELRTAVLAAMKKRKLSHSQLAREVHATAGVGVSTVHRWLSGQGNTTDETINAVLNHLGLDISEKT